MHLCIEVTAATWMMEAFGEVGGDVPEYFSLRNEFSKNDAVKSYCKKIILKYYSCIFFSLWVLSVSKLNFGRLAPNIVVVCFIKNGSFHPIFFLRGGGAKLLFLTPKCEISIQN